jgi:hypothetical protein
MGQGWTAERVTQLAPDPASAKAGQGLASPRKWVSLGRDDAAAWGECQGSGAKPYQVQVDLAEPAFKCSCPSRKFPCKHGIGLMLLFAASESAVAPAARPAWVEEWIGGRAERAAKKQSVAEAPPKPVDEAAQARRREKRLTRTAEGLAAVRVWAEDLVRTGLATAPTRGYAFYDEPARRMIDAQAPGVARRLQMLGEIAAASGAGWQRSFLEGLASVHLLARAFERLDQLPQSTRDDVLATLGIAERQEEVLNLPPVGDRWQILAQEVDVEDRLRVQRTWLFGAQARRPALVLAFAHGNAPLDASLAPGCAFDGELCFFPGNGVRAAVKSRGELSDVQKPVGFDTLDALCDAASALFARQPWLGETAAPLGSVIPAKADAGWSLIDRDGRSLPCVMGESAGWTALAVSGGTPIDVAAAYDGRRLRPLAILTPGEHVRLTAPGAEGGD